MSGPNLSGPDSDVLQRAAAALRAAHDGQREGSGFTRARILATVASRRRPRLRRWLMLAPLGSALLVGSAWAQSTGSWPRVWQAVAAVLPFVEPTKPEPLERHHRAPVDRPRQQPEAPVAEQTPTEETPTTATAELTPPATTQPSNPTQPSAQPLPRPSRARRVAPSPPEPAPDPELRRFRAAHELHVQGQPRAAITAYEDYLQAYPSGRFVPEARYNSALDAIKVGELAAARRLLEPFAAGEYGEYRRAEAQRLLDALSAAGSR